MIRDYYDNYEVPVLSEEDCKNVAVVGNGSFGTAIANIIVHNGHKVTLYGRNADAIAEMSATKINKRYLPDARLSEEIVFTSDIIETVSDKDIIVFAVPAQQFRKVLSSAASSISKETIIVNLAKGIEQGTLKRMSEIAEEIIPENTYVALSGPSHAEELVKNYPASVVVASKSKEAAYFIQDVFTNDNFRVYTDWDVPGVEIAGSLKNVYAIATGISDGMEYGVNAKAALMTRAIHELSKLGVLLGAHKATFAGLSGIGDLIVTCDSDLSRNRRFGRMIGEGLSCSEAIDKVGSVVEGYYTTSAAKELAVKLEVDCPIIMATAAVLEDTLTPGEALKLLMTRDKKEEKK